MWLFWIVECEVVVNGNVDFVGVEVVGFKEVDIVGCYYWQIVCFCQCYGGVEIGFFILLIGMDQFQKIVVWEMFFVEGDVLFNQWYIVVDQVDVDVIFLVVGEQNQFFLMFYQLVVIDLWFQGVVVVLIGMGN